MILYWFNSCAYLLAVMVKDCKLGFQVVLKDVPQCVTATRCDQRLGAALLWREAGRAGITQPGEDKTPGTSHCGLPVPKRGHKKEGDGSFYTGRE